MTFERIAALGPQAPRPNGRVLSGATRPPPSDTSQQALQQAHEPGAAHCQSLATFNERRRPSS